MPASTQVRPDNVDFWAAKCVLRQHGKIVAEGSATDFPGAVLEAYRYNVEAGMPGPVAITTAGLAG